MTTAIPVSKAKTLAFALACLALGGLGASLIYVGTSQPLRDAFLAYLFGVPLVLFGALFVAGTARLLFQSAPAVLIDAHGITENASPMGGVGLIPWRDIVRFSRQGVESPLARFEPGWMRTPVPVIRIHVRNPDAYAERGWWMTRPIRRSNQEMFGTPLGIVLWFLEGRPGEIARQLDSALQAHGA